MKMKTLVLTLCLVLLSACVDGGSEAQEDSGPTPGVSGAPSPTASGEGFATGKAILDGDDGSVLLDVEIADSPEQHSLGLMHRTELASDAGMVFIFFEPTDGAFWMKNTLIPLSIAFFDQEGTIVRILDMEPCEADPCPVYAPEAVYIGALEVNQGSFDEWNIKEGDSVRVIHDARDGLQ
jgi:uncharacterized membrane protein (UPF0127 family)